MKLSYPSHAILFNMLGSAVIFLVKYLLQYNSIAAEFLHKQLILKLKQANAT